MSEEKEQKVSKEEILAFVKDIESRISKNSEAHLHSLLGLNKIMRASNIDTVMDKKLKERLKAVWTKLKTAGVTLVDPPLLFGLPQNFSTKQSVEDEPEYLPEYADEDISKKAEEKTEASSVTKGAEKKAAVVKKTKKPKAEKASTIN